MKRATTILVLSLLLALPLLSIGFEPPVANAMMGGIFGHGGGMGQGPSSHGNTGAMDATAMAEAMKSPKFTDMMAKNSNMQQAFMTMMQNPEMQSIVRQFMQKDAGFRNSMMGLLKPPDSPPASTLSPSTSPVPSSQSEHKGGHAE